MQKTRQAVMRSAGAMIGVVIVSMAAFLPAAVAATSGSMPAAEQNALVGKYCAVCHTDAARNGGLSLQHFDATHPDPGVAAMVLAKLKSGAIGAAGLPAPGRETEEAWIRATEAEAVGADQWVIDRAASPTMLTASIVQAVPSTMKGAPGPDFFRLTFTCDANAHQAEVQLAWSPAEPKQGTVLSAAVDGKPFATYKVEGTEKMGNGANGSSGPGSILLYATRAGSSTASFPLPARTLAIANFFPNETVVFPFDMLEQTARHAFSECFPAGR